MKTSTIIWLVIIIAVLGIGLYFYYQIPSPANQAQKAATDDASAQNAVPAAPITAPMQATVLYGPNGFSPSSATVKQGGTVTFVNQGSGKMWVGADKHPIHEDYDGTNKNQHCAAGYGGPAPFDQCSVGSTYSFTFTKTGSWEYHNHANASDGGIIEVVQ